MRGVINKNDWSWCNYCEEIFFILCDLKNFNEQPFFRLRKQIQQFAHEQNILLFTTFRLFHSRDKTENFAENKSFYFQTI